MKMTKSTSRISISGTTFISEIVPNPRPPSDISMSHLAYFTVPREEDSHTLRRPGGGRPQSHNVLLLTGLELGRDQPYFVDSRPAHDVNGAGYFHEQNIVVALDESDLLGALFEN